MNFPRASGILLHPTSLPGRLGIGDFGPKAYEFVDFLVRAGQTYWQILPLGPTGQGNSPYSSYSAFAGNTLLISPEKLVDDNLISLSVLETAPEFPAERVDYQKVAEWKSGMLANAFESFCSLPPSQLSDEFEDFSQKNAWWLEDYAVFRALKVWHGQ